MTARYYVLAPATPGAAPTVLHAADRIRDARTLASQLDDRGDLTYQDVRIERRDGSLVEFAGPAR